MWYYTYPFAKEKTELPLCLYSIGLHSTQPPLSRPNGHAHDQLFYNTKGSGTLVANMQKYELPERCCFFIPAGMPHKYYPSGDVWDIRWFVAYGQSIKQLYKALGLDFRIAPLKDPSRLDYLMNRMRGEVIFNETDGNLFASSYINEFVIEFACQMGLIKREFSYSEPERTSYIKHMRHMMDYIDGNYMNKITMNDLCSLEGLTPQHICRIFKCCTRMRPTEYIARIRIDNAKGLLVRDSRSICEIALLCGFENENYFWKTFKRITGVTPGEYRAANSLYLY